MALVGFAAGLLVVTEFKNWVIPAWDAGLILMGSTILGALIGTRVAGSRIPKANADFWETGALGQLATTAAFAACAAVAWAFALAIAFGTRIR